MIRPDASHQVESGEVVVELQSVSKSYGRLKGRVIEALTDIDLRVVKGELFALLGPSGCGKSTLLHMISGLVQPTRGLVKVLNEIVREPIPSKVSLVLQKTTLLPWRSAIENVEFPQEVRGIPKAKRREEALQYLTLVGLSEFVNTYPYELSGGMAQRVAIARALCQGTEIILMDEPFGALDEQTRTLLGEELLRIQRATRKTIIFVTHSIEEAIYLSERIALLSAHPGRIRTVLDVKLPSRSPEVRFSPEFNLLKSHIWRHLREEVVFSRSPKGSV